VSAQAGSGLTTAVAKGTVVNGPVNGPATGAIPAAVELETAAGGTFAVDWRAWRPVDEAVLCFIRRGGDLLLIRKKRGLGAGKFNAPGGRLERGETPAQAAVRETQEEVGLTPRELRHAGRLHFAFTNGHGIRCDVFEAAAFDGTPVETDEALPFWQSAAAIPYHEMWADDRVWVPLMLERRPFEAWFVFEDDLMLWHLLRVGR